MKNHTTITIFAWIVRETEKAYLVKDALDKEAWIPKSQAKKEAIEGKEGKFKFNMPEWLAKEKSLA